MLLAQGHGHLDGIDGVADASAGQAVDSCAGGNNAERPQARDPLADGDDALIAIGKMFNGAGRMLWKRMSIRKGKSKSKGKHESFDVATIRAEDDLTLAQSKNLPQPSSGSTLYDEASTDFVALSQDDALSEADLQALIDMGTTTPNAPAIVVVTDAWTLNFTFLCALLSVQFIIIAILFVTTIGLLQRANQHSSFLVTSPSVLCHFFVWMNILYV